jgi:hypothetical protein
MIVNIFLFLQSYSFEQRCAYCEVRLGGIHDHYKLKFHPQYYSGTARTS